LLVVLWLQAVIDIVAYGQLLEVRLREQFSKCSSPPRVASILTNAIVRLCTGTLSQNGRVRCEHARLDDPCVVGVALAATLLGLA